MTNQEVFIEIMGFPPATKPPDAFFNDKGKFVPKLLGDAIQEKMKFVATSSNSEIWKYNPKNGIWENNGFETIQAIVSNWLGDLFKPIYASDTEKYIRFTNYINPELLGGPPNKIVLKNGVYDLETDVFDTFDPELYAIQALAFNYDPTASIKKIEKFLKEVCPERVQTLKEMSGYCLYRGTPLHRFFVLVGGGRNGKGTYINLIKRLLGNRNVASVSLQQLDNNRFKAAELHGKLANLNNDIPSQTLKNTGILKQLTSGDLITVEKKNRDPFQFENYAKLIFSANIVPMTRDDTDAFYRRAITIPFDQVFEDGVNADPDILEKITTEEELSGFFNESIQSLKTLFKRGKFYGEKTVEERKMEYIKLSNPIQYFAITKIKKNLDSYVIKKDLYNAYVELCEELNKIPTSDNWFAKNVRRYLPYTHEGMIEISGKNVKIWRGIQLTHTEYTQYTQFPHPPQKLDDYKEGRRENTVYCVGSVGEDQSLQNKLDEFLELLSDVESKSGYDVIEILEFTKYLCEQGWKATDVKRIYDILKRDKMIFEPRPGFIKRCSP